MSARSEAAHQRRRRNCVKTVAFRAINTQTPGAFLVVFFPFPKQAVQLSLFSKNPNCCICARTGAYGTDLQQGKRYPPWLNQPNCLAVPRSATRASFSLGAATPLRLLRPPPPARCSVCVRPTVADADTLCPSRQAKVGRSVWRSASSSQVVTRSAAALRLNWPRCTPSGAAAQPSRPQERARAGRPSGAFRR